MITVGPAFDIVVPPRDVFILFDAALRDISIKLILCDLDHPEIWHYLTSTFSTKTLLLTNIFTLPSGKWIFFSENKKTIEKLK